eukprot:TRINITY_DN7784_c1_g1_i2.p1 TRINITY_DN7784_c1_g1~~TRINITY_DN7784_c1_g1_i2.p1  ORF type:complete len:183 (-),score=38.23 TRINITY_DN7784_c1_g1_i2:292-840(-)
MSLESHLNWQSCIQKELVCSMKSAVKEIGEDNMEKLRSGKLREVHGHLFRRSASEALLRGASSTDPLSTAVRGDTLHQAGSSLLKRQQKMEKAVQKEIERQTQEVRDQLSYETSARKRLYAEIHRLNRLRETQRKEASVSLKGPTLWAPDPNPKLKPVPEPPKRFVHAVHPSACGMPSYQMA